MSLTTRKSCELERDGIHTDLLASWAQVFPLIVLLKVPIINREAIALCQDAGTHRPGGGQGPACLDDIQSMTCDPASSCKPFYIDILNGLIFYPVL